MEDSDARYVELRVGKNKQKFLLDTGACISVINKDLWTELAYGYSQLTFLGICKANVTWKNDTETVDLHVIEKCSDNLLGRDLIRQLNLNVGDLYDNPRENCTVNKKDLEESIPKHDDEMETGKNSQKTLTIEGQVEPIRTRPAPYAMKAKAEFLQIMAFLYRLFLVALAMTFLYPAESQARFLIGKRPSSRGMDSIRIFGFVNDGASQYGSIIGTPQDNYNSLVSLRGRYGK
ncbi:hypothetical protein QR680_019094 [Steinernema hermaphroditum]|uniref:Retropepsins domain-containing protein n=1 Tax=Steinernema hermaphroditum TaxID=289476 RepID=A0AA39LRB4_9BILA|nr:hypothetical protein QR680_019094 [Steinernema hermaphroditum]